MMWLLLALALAALLTESWAINCYTCSSVNGSQPYCEDPIDTSMAPLTERCQVPKNNHKGLFPANFCLKIVGKNVATYERLVIRACAMKSMDSQCGMFRYEEAEMSGCVLTCDNSGCNGARRLAPAAPSAMLPSALSLAAAAFSLFSSSSSTTLANIPLLSSIL